MRSSLPKQPTPSRTVNSAPHPGRPKADPLSSARSALSGPSRPLDGSTLTQMESRFHRDFGRVQVHTGDSAASANRDLGSTAFSFGNHIAFGRNQYSPGTASGRRLLAHELAHVARSRVREGMRPAGIGPEDSPFEKEAQAAAGLGRFDPAGTPDGHGFIRRNVPPPPPPGQEGPSMEEDVAGRIQDLPTRTNEEAAARIMELVDGFTTDDPEREILAILSSLPPAAFADVIREMAGRDYLDDLYEDMHGDEFEYYLAITNVKLVAAGAGTLADLPETVAGLEAGTLGRGIRVFRPVHMTDPGTWNFRSYPHSAEYRGGILRLFWNTHTDWWVVNPDRELIELGPTDLLTVDNRETGTVTVMSPPEVKKFSDDYQFNSNLAKLNLIGMVAGFGGLAAAETVAARGTIALFQIAIPAAGQYIADHENEIAAMEGGPEFLAAWRIFNLALAAYGVVEIARSGMRLVTSLQEASENLNVRNPGNATAGTARERVGEVVDLSEYRNLRAARTPEPPVSQPSASGNNALDINAQPAQALPERIPDIEAPLPSPETAPLPVPDEAPRTTAGLDEPIRPRNLWPTAQALANAMQANTGLSPRSPLPFHWRKPMVDGLYPRQLDIPDAITPNILDRDAEPTPVTYLFRRRAVTEDFGIDAANRPFLGKMFEYIPERNPGQEREDPERSRFVRTMDTLGFDRDGLQMDHVFDMQFGGQDHFQNIWPADERMNMSAGTSHRAQVEAYRQRLGNLAGRWFAISRISV